MGWWDSVPSGQSYEVNVTNSDSGHDEVVRFTDDPDSDDPRNIQFTTPGYGDHPTVWNTSGGGKSKAEYSYVENDDGTRTYSAEVSGKTEVEFVLPKDIDSAKFVFYPPEYKSAIMYETFSDNSFDEPWSTTHDVDGFPPLKHGWQEQEERDLLDLSSFVEEALLTAFTFNASHEDKIVYLRYLPIKETALKDLWVSINAEAFTDWDRYQDGSNIVSEAFFNLVLLADVLDYDGNPSSGGVALSLPEIGKIISGEAEVWSGFPSAGLDYFLDSNGVFHINPWISDKGDFRELADAYSNAHGLSRYGSTYNFDYEAGETKIKHAFLAIEFQITSW